MRPKKPTMPWPSLNAEHEVKMIQFGIEELKDKAPQLPQGTPGCCCFKAVTQDDGSVTFYASG